MEIEKLSTGGQELKLKEFILATKDGVALVDAEGNETLYRKKNINDLFCIARESNINNIEYIYDDLNMYKIASVKITLADSRKFSLEVL